jgi:hypothetical protein
MDKLGAVNRLCYALCVGSVLLGGVLSIFLVWDLFVSELTTKILLTDLVVFIASALILGANHTKAGLIKFNKN